MEDEEKREMRKTPGLGLGGRAKSLVEACSALRQEQPLRGNPMPPAALPLPLLRVSTPSFDPGQTAPGESTESRVPIQGSQKEKRSYHARNMRSRLSAGRPKSCRPRLSASHGTRPTCPSHWPMAMAIILDRLPYNLQPSSHNPKIPESAVEFITQLVSN